MSVEIITFKKLFFFSPVHLASFFLKYSFGRAMLQLEFGKSKPDESQSEQSITETRKAAFCSSETLKSNAGSGPAAAECPVSNPDNLWKSPLLRQQYLYRRVSHDVVAIETSANGWPPWLIPFLYLWIWSNHVHASCMSMYNCSEINRYRNVINKGGLPIALVSMVTTLCEKSLFCSVRGPLQSARACQTKVPGFNPPPPAISLKRKFTRVDSPIQGIKGCRWSADFDFISNSQIGLSGQTWGW